MKGALKFTALVTSIILALAAPSLGGESIQGQIAKFNKISGPEVRSPDGSRFSYLEQGTETVGFMARIPVSVSETMTSVGVLSFGLQLMRLAPDATREMRGGLYYGLVSESETGGGPYYLGKYKWTSGRDGADIVIIAIVREQP